MSTSKSDSHLAHSGGERAGVATRRWVSHRSATPNPPTVSQTRATSANAGQPLLDMCPRCLLCCGFLRFPVVSCCFLRAGYSSSEAFVVCGVRPRCVLRGACVYSVWVPRVRGPVVLCHGAIAHRRYKFVRCSVDFYFDIGSSLTSARGRGRCGRAAPATNEACKHKPMHNVCRPWGACKGPAPAALLCRLSGIVPGRATRVTDVL